MNKSYSALFREFLLENNCHRQLRRHLEGDQRKWMKEEMELFFHRRIEYHRGGRFRSAFSLSRTYVLLYLVTRQATLTDVANRFLDEHLSKQAALSIKYSERLRYSRGDYMDRLTKSVAHKYRDEIFAEEGRILLLHKEDNEMFFSRLEFLEKQADIHSIQGIDAPIKDCECAEIAIGKINDASVIDSAFGA